MAGKRIYPAKLESLLRDWYGDEAPGAVEAHLPSARTLSDTLISVTTKKIPAGRLKIIQIQSHWDELVGTDNAHRAIPSGLANGVLYIEVLHPVYRMALDTEKVKKPILEKIQALVGKTYCRELKFVPAGRRQRSNPE